MSRLIDCFQFITDGRKRRILALSLASLLLPSLVAMAAGLPVTAREIKMYLHNGSDVTGTLIRLDENSYEIKTPKGVEKIPRKLYQGMVLNTPEEKVASERMSTDFQAYMAASMYFQELKKKILAGIKSPKTSCKTNSFPLAHFQIKRDGKIQNLILLVSSNCQEYDHALLQAIKSLKPMPLRDDYPLDVYPVNFSFDPANPSGATPKSAVKSEK